jgi:hypothetical protein
VSFEEKKQKDQKDLGRFGFLFSDAKRKKNRCRHMLRNSQKCKWEAKETKAISKVDKKDSGFCSTHKVIIVFFTA